MMKKKIFYIILFILMIIVIGIFIVNLNTKQTQKTENNSSNTSSIQNTENNTVLNNDNTEDVTADMNNVIDIKEKMFIQQLNDVFLNIEQYEGKTLRLQGFMYHYYESTENKTYYYVMRNTPGCCGNDGSAGLEIIWNNDYPKDNEWVEATGVIKKVDEGGYYGNVPVLYLTKLEVKKERGADFVSQ